MLKNTPQPSALFPLPSGMSTYLNRLQNGETLLARKLAELSTVREQVWKNRRVRLAYIRHKHMEYVSDVHKGRGILESESTIKILNLLHGHLYGNKANKVAGPALCGPPGWGKTTILQEYFRSFGVEPLSIDIDPGQSSFTLMASPSLGLEQGMKGINDLIGTINDLDPDRILELYEHKQYYFENTLGITPEEIRKIGGRGDDQKLALLSVQTKLKRPLQSQFNKELADMLESMTERKGFTYGPILKALQDNRPIIINEFPELNDWTFLHGLLLAIPASDAEAAPKPTDRPKDGQTAKNPRGWFFNTISAEWMRVGEHFRVCFTGNIGIEYNNAGAPLALLSRIGSGQIQFEGMPAKEMARTIAWPYLSSKETGKFLLDDQQAYRLYFFVTEIMPRLQKRLDESCKGKHWPISNRVLIDICRSMNPETNTDPCDLDEAIMKSLIRPSHALRYTDSLEEIVAILQATGFLKGHAKEIDTMLKDFGSGRLAALIQDLQKEVGEYSKDRYKKQETLFDGACMVCEVDHCPCHGEDAQEFSEYLSHSASLSKVILDERMLQRLLDWQTKLAEQKQWSYFVRSTFGKVNPHQAERGLAHDNVKDIAKYLLDLVKKCQDDPQRVSRDFPLIAEGVERMYITKTHLTGVWADGVLAYWFRNMKAIPADQDLDDCEEFGDFLAFLVRYTQSIERDAVYPQEVKALLLRAAQSTKKVEYLWALNRLPSPDVELKSILTGRLEKKEDFCDELEGWRVHLAQITTQPLEVKKTATDSKKKPTKPMRSQPKPLRSALQVPQFETNAEEFVDVLFRLKRLLDLKIVMLSEVSDVVDYIENELKKVTQKCELPVSYMAYIQVIKLLSQVKKVSLDEALDFFFLDKAPPSPVMRNF